MPLMPALGGRGRGDLCGFEANLVYRMKKLLNVRQYRLALLELLFVHLESCSEIIYVCLLL